MQSKFTIAYVRRERSVKLGICELNVSSQHSFYYQLSSCFIASLDRSDCELKECDQAGGNGRYGACALQQPRKECEFEAARVTRDHVTIYQETIMKSKLAEFKVCNFQR